MKRENESGSWQEVVERTKLRNRAGSPVSGARSEGAMPGATSTSCQFVGPEATELSVLSRPDSGCGGDVAQQTASAYRQLLSTLSAQQASLDNVVREVVFFRDIEGDLEKYQAARHRVLEDLGTATSYWPTSTFIQQPPLDPALRFEILVSAVQPRLTSFTVDWEVKGTPTCSCSSCADVKARVVVIGAEKHIHAGSVFGAPGTPFEEASDMFRCAEQLVKDAGTDFGSVVRTWIYLRHMERDYDDLNRARTEFFKQTGITLRPASTGINGAPFHPEHNFSMGLYAINSPKPLQAEIMTTPTLNEAWEYGSDFSRGLRVLDANKTTLFVSGTASVDEKGDTVHVGDFEAQVDRMLLNIATLLEEQKASFENVVSGITYLKNAEDAAHYYEVVKSRELDRFPHALVEAPVCRPDLLCEMEVTALLPRSRPS